MVRDEKRALLLAGYYVPNLGYQENGWAKALTQLGVRTKVVARPDCIPSFRDLLDYEAKVKNYISELGLEYRVLSLPLANRNELNALYNAADIGIGHLLPSITLVESMGTGLPVVIPDVPSFNSQTLHKECVEIFKLGKQPSLRV